MDITASAIINLLAQVNPAEAGVLDDYRVGASNVRTAFPTTDGPDIAFSRTFTVPASGSLTVTVKDFTIPADSGAAYKDSDGVDLNIERIYGIAFILRNNADDDATIPTQAEFDFGPFTANPDGGTSAGAADVTTTGLLENIGSCCMFTWPEGVEIETSGGTSGATQIAFVQALAGSDALVEVVVVGKSE